MSPGEWKMLMAGTYRKRPTGAPAVLDAPEALEIVLLAAVEAAASIAQASLLSAIEPELIYCNRLRWAAVEGLRRALAADYEGHSHDRIEAVVERLDRVRPIEREETRSIASGRNRPATRRRSTRRAKRRRTAISPT